MAVVSVRKVELKKQGYSDFKEWSEEKNHIYIGRNMSFYVPGTLKSKWANPFTVKKFGLEESLKKYEKYVKETPALIESLSELRGKTLGCWCRTDSSPKEPVCHGDILLKLLKAR